jgi:hypothetical protein
MTLAVIAPTPATEVADTADLLADLAAAAADKDITALVAVAVELGRRLGPRGYPAPEPPAQPGRGHATTTRTAAAEPEHVPGRAVRRTRPTAEGLRRMVAAGEPLLPDGVDLSGGQWR